MSTQEQDIRVGILNTLLTPPHRALEKIYPVHQELIGKDPRFYVQLAAWYHENGDVRDHKEMFAVNLALSDFPGHRDVGLAMLRGLPPYEVVRVVDFISGRKKTRKVRKGEEKKALAQASKRTRQRIARKHFGTEKPEPAEAAAEPDTVTEEFGLFRNVPRAMKTEITRYLREREAEPDWFDSTVLGALIEQMSPQELINSLGALKRRGVLDVPEIKAMIEAKLAGAKTAERVSALKAEKAVEAADLSPEIRKALEDVADTQIKAKGRISRPTAILVDKSSSMHEAIELGKRIGAMVSAICESELYTYAFDTMAHEITARGRDLADWERAFQGITANGATSCGVALKYLQRKKQYVEQECRHGGVQVDVFLFTGDYYSLPNLVPMLSRPSRLELLMEIMDYPLPKRKTA